MIRGQLNGIRVGRTWIEYLISSFMMIASYSTKYHMKNVRKEKIKLIYYENVFGQIINFQKSSIFFFFFLRRNVGEEVHGDLFDKWGVWKPLNNEGILKFLLLSVEIWKPFLCLWRIDFATDKGIIVGQISLMIKQLIIIKAIVQSSSKYCMSIFLRHICLIFELERMMNSFWRGNKNDTISIGINWIKGTFTNDLYNFISQ